MNRDNEYNVNRIQQYTKAIFEHFQRRVNTFCIRHDAEFGCGMGTHFVRLCEDFSVIYEDGSQDDMSAKQYYFPEEFERFDLPEMEKEWNEIDAEAREVEEELNWNFSILDSLDDFNGSFRYHNGYPKNQTKIVIAEK